ncbi:hypothetical protein NPIL_51341 [Nephila pilipes]|uniref:Uncharacterized protein n=1 Tax=Nephila pilipes TaxID=299642 RepID=A0A8X6NLW1_NEPPI|nr:hypothetical protein NPIL_51341 [Nephila pilipes]
MTKGIFTHLNKKTTGLTAEGVFKENRERIEKFRRACTHSIVMLGETARFRRKGSRELHRQLQEVKDSERTCLNSFLITMKRISSGNRC